MKPIWIKFNSIAMVIILFTVSSGFTLFTHMCFMSDEQSVTIIEQHSCCAVEGPNSDIKIESSCCEHGFQFVKLELSTVVSKENETSNILSDIEFIPYIFYALPLIPESQVICRSNPPPILGRDILSSIQVFQI